MSLPLIISLTILIVGVVGLILTRMLRQRYLSRITIDEEDARRLSAELLDYVRQKSYEPRTEVVLRPFWKKHRGLSAGDKYVIQEPMHQSDLFLMMRESGFWNEIAEKIGNWAYETLPQKVVLNPQEWHRMVHGNVPAQTIINGNVDLRTIQQRIINKNTGSGAILSGASTGDGAGPSFSDIKIEQRGLAAQQLVELAKALRSDAAHVDAPEVKALVLRLAEDVDDAAADPAPSQKTARRLIERATDYARLVTGGLTQTSKLIESISDVIEKV